MAQQPFSVVAGASWGTDRFSVRGNFVRESATYLPLLGYFAGDRQGLFAETHYRVSPRIELYGSGSAYSNNLENNRQLPTFHSSGLNGGGSIILPWKFNTSASISTLHFTSQDPSQPNLGPSDNRQMNLTMSRPVKHHNLRISLIYMKLNYNYQLQMQRYTEFADDFTWKHLIIGGAMRVQNSSSVSESRNTIFYRGSIQANVRRISVYAYAETGNDLVNKSVFSTNAYGSTVAGISTPLAKGWNLQVEAFRNSLNTTLNAENVFLFPGQNLGLTQLPGFNQWSVYLRIGKHLQWGTELSATAGIEQYVAARVPLVGSLQGLVLEESLGGVQPAANVAILLDHYRTALTDGTGHYVFKDVPEGPHEVGVDMEQLPTTYQQGPQTTTRVFVEPRSLVRSDFTVTRLTSLTGQIMASGGVPVENVVIRLTNTNRYTTPNEDGTFAFYNLREGEYTVSIDEQSLPEDVLLTSPNNLSVLASSANTPATLEFVIKVKPEAEKPVRQILQEQIHVGGTAENPQGGDGAKPGSAAKKSYARASTVGSASKTGTTGTNASHGGLGQAQ